MVPTCFVETIFPVFGRRDKLIPERGVTVSRHHALHLYVNKYCLIDKELLRVVRALSLFLVAFVVEIFSLLVSYSVFFF
jgi:hypothetical protein